jgi:hydrophobic/amphiphilic exporter-1 (mainly G- bacteria), HAE1 family
MKITDFSLKRSVAVVVLSIAAMALGVFALLSLDVDYLPDIKYPMVKIHIFWRGATPEEIETNIADPVERGMATVDNLDYLDTSCIEGMYTLLVNFRYGVDVDVAYQDVLAVMGRVTRNLPPDIDPPLIIKADPSQLPVMEVTLASDRHSLVWLRDWADNWLSDRLSAVPGTAGTEVVGGLVREIRVHLDPVRMTAYNLSPDQVAAALKAENRQIFAGRVTVETREIIARTMGEFENLDEIRNTAVAHGPNGELVYVRDIAQVEDSHEEMRVSTRFNGRPCVKVNVLKQAEANTVSVAQGVKAKLDQLRPEIPEGIEFGVVENQGDYVMGAILSVRDSALLSALLVILVVYIFLGHWRQVAVMVIALPLTLLANFFVMKLAGFSLNIFSLGGLVVALGVILDNSIVVLENITRLKHEADTLGHGETKGLVQTGTAQVGPAIIASTLTFLGIFLPFLIVPGMAALLFKELVLVVASIVLLSLIVATTVTPLLTEWLVIRARARHLTGLAAAFDHIVDRMMAGYGRLLGLVLRARWLIIAAFVILFFVGFHWAKLAGSEFLPQPDDGRVMVKLKMPAGTSVVETDRILAAVEQQVQGQPEIESVFTMAGGRVWGLATYEIAQEGEVDIQLVPKAKRDVTTEEFVERITPMVKKAMAPGAKLPVMQMKVKGVRQIGLQTVEIKVQGSEIQPIYEFAQQAAKALNETPGIVNVNISMDMTKPEYRIYVDRARASALGIPVNQVAATLRTLIGGLVSTEYREGSEYYDIRVMVPEPSLKNKEDVENLILETRNGRAIHVRDVAEVRRAVGPVEITRENQIKQVIVRADGAPGVSAGDAIAQSKAVVADLPRPAGVGFAMGGQAEMMAENGRTMRTILFFAALFAYVVLAIQFNSYVLPVLAMLGIPFALTGAFGALYAFHIPIGVTVMIGLVVMMGGIASQGVVLLSLAEELRAAGKSAFDAIRQAAPLRLRPILMTQLTTVLGLLPLALNLGEGGDMLKPMAIAVIGGLLYSLLLTLFFLPAAYALAMKKKEILAA